MLSRSESKYFATAARMDEAFLALLEKKDFAYITVKEICAAAGVNRSTFYLHYETLSDLLAESTEHMTRQFQAYMAHDSEAFIAKLRTCPQEELYLVTPEYLTPYLRYIREHRRMFRHVLTPILDRCGVPEEERAYRMAFYIHGLMAIITEWLKRDCADADERIISVMQKCVMPHREEA